MNYPVDPKLRKSFKTKEGKVYKGYIDLPCANSTVVQTVTPHQWAVYDFVKNIPVGKVTTYKV